MSATDGPTQVLEFDLGTNRYCLDIQHVSQIVDRQPVTGVPNAPSHVAGVTDLRGRTTTVVDPSVLLDVEAGSDAAHILVLGSGATDSDGAIGWQIDAVHRVVDVDPDDIEAAPMTSTDGVEGLINADDGFVIWVTPELHAGRAG